MSNTTNPTMWFCSRGNVGVVLEEEEQQNKASSLLEACNPDSWCGQQHSGEEEEQCGCCNHIVDASSPSHRSIHPSTICLLLSAVVAPVPVSPRASLLRLINDDVLRIIFLFVGPDRYRFMGGVNRRWRRIYIEAHKHPHSASWRTGKTTTFSAAVESKTTLALALNDPMNFHRFRRQQETEQPREEEGQQQNQQQEDGVSEWPFHVFLHSVSPWIADAVAAGRQRFRDMMFHEAPVQEKQDSHLNICALAARGGHLDTLQWVRAEGYCWDVRTCACAAQGGYLELLQWARAHGCDWDSSTCNSAALCGHLEVLQWARAHGCEWDATTLGLARFGGHAEIVAWAEANGYETPSN